jgi:hypothetical protein
MIIELPSLVVLIMTVNIFRAAAKTQRLVTRAEAAGNPLSAGFRQSAGEPTSSLQRARATNPPKSAGVLDMVKRVVPSSHLQLAKKIPRQTPARCTLASQ